MQKEPSLKRNYILAALMMTMMLAAMDATIVSTAIPQIVSDLGGFKEFSWVFSIYLLAQTVTIPIYGKLSDIFGRKKILIFGISIFLIGSATSAIAWNITTLIIFRGVQGLGAGSIMSSVNTIAGDIYTVKERAKIQGWLSSIWGISAIIGPALGGALAKYIDWRWIFLINLPIGIIGIGLLAYFFKEKTTSHRPKIDYKGSLLIFLTTGLFILYVQEGGQSIPWWSIKSLSFLSLIIVLAVLTYKHAKKADHAVFPLWIWKKKTFAFTNIAMVFMGIVMMGPQIFLPTFTQTSLGLGIIASGFVLASMSIGWPAASALSGKLYLKIGFRNTSLIGTVLITLACAGFIFIPWPQPIYLIVIDQIVLGAGLGLVSTPTMVGVQSVVNWHQRGVVTGLVVFCRNLGQSLGAAIMGTIFINSFQDQIKNAPFHLTESTANILDVVNDENLAPAKKIFLQKTISDSTVHIYIGLTFFAILLLWAVYRLPVRLRGT